MEILQYLLELLKTSKQIGLEGLGTFYKKKTPGRYDAATHSFLPPSYALEFTTEVLEKTNLAAYIHHKRGISEDSANYFISQFVTELQKSLQNGTLTLEHLGTFKSEDGKLTFNPSQDINTGFDFFALPSVNAEIKPTQEKVIDEPADVAIVTPVITDEHQIEQVKVPEFEQEIGKLEFTAAENSPIDEEITAVAPQENDVASDEELSVAEENTAKPELEDITDVPAEPVEETTAVEAESVTEDEKETWNFDDEQVVSNNDTKSEEVVSNTPVATPTNTDENKPEDIKLKSTTQEWSFDTIERKPEPEENILHSEFDNQYIEEEHAEAKHKMPLYQKLSLALLVIAVAFVVLYFAKPEIFENFRRDTTNPNDKIVVPIQRSNLKTQKDSLSFADSIMKNAEKVGLDVQPAKDTLVVTTSKKETPITYTYDIIIASFATEGKAQAYIDRMKKKGFDAKVSTMHGKRKNISIATYNNIDSAQKYVIKFRKQFNNLDIYAQPIKNK